jgi:hypothetical protein
MTSINYFNSDIDYAYSTQYQYFKFIVSVNFIDGDVRCMKRKFRHLTPPYLSLVPSHHLHFHRHMSWSPSLSLLDTSTSITQWRG